MLKIEAVIRSTKLQQVKNELEQIGITAFSTFKVEMSGLSHGQTSGGRPGTFKTSALIPKTKIEIICRDKDKDAITEAISKGARTGQVGDGIVYVYPLAHLIKIKNGKTNEQAV
ncbi:P-II family nitrogen regulator [Candidatus Nitrosotenuis chungbukensis]|uniref:P-II family nitrogen regulator n=1 Tax=Candidatus Nitrosotenuis TaxID=1825023 RepID=UPI0005B2BAE0|nr:MULTISPECIES: P-II family nitrogen regulator [Nitrosotenuis]QLH09039.1 P-II family nitrogen regulator [Candidatus Nitrosotenuis sp. DW1]WKT57636.1 P-II family nitrogen regulator [Candidatus Nitrosotenuis chungbukensis]